MANLYTNGIQWSLHPEHANMDSVTAVMTGMHQDMNLREEARMAHRAALIQEQTFTEKHGIETFEATAKVLQVGTDDQFPELHCILAACKDNSRHANMIQSKLTALATASKLPLSNINGPVMTPHLLALFRSHDLIGSMTNFGEGLTCVSTVMRGHPGAKEVKKQLRGMLFIESGSTLTLSDARAVATSDPRFCTGSAVTIAKLRGAWPLGPTMSNIITFYGEDIVGIMTVLYRIMFTWQQLTFA